MRKVNLIQTDSTSIIYGDFKGKPDQELFRCPRGLDDKDLRRFINDNRLFIRFEEDNVEDLHNVEGKEFVGYYRMYFRGGWYGRWFIEPRMNPTELECKGIDEIIGWFWEKYPKGCDYFMRSEFETVWEKWDGDERYLLKPFMSDYYKVLVDTKYGNGDYPVRIYLYRNKEVI